MVLRVEKQREVQVMFREGAKCNALLCLQEDKVLREMDRSMKECLQKTTKNWQT